MSTEKLVVWELARISNHWEQSFLGVHLSTTNPMGSYLKWNASHADEKSMTNCRAMAQPVRWLLFSFGSSAYWLCVLLQPLQEELLPSKGSGLRVRARKHSHSYAMRTVKQLLPLILTFKMSGKPCLLLSTGEIRGSFINLIFEECVLKYLKGI
jgi:hypothetical protein